MTIKFLKDQDFPDSLRDQVLRRMTRSPLRQQKDAAACVDARPEEPAHDDLAALLEWGRKQAQRD